MVPEGDPLSTLLITVILIAVNAFFAMSEIAVISFNDVKLEKLAEEGDKRAKILVKLTGSGQFLSTIQVGVTLASFFSSAVAADTFVEYVVYWLRDLPIRTDILRACSLVVVTVTLSFISLIFGELVPKRIAMNNPEGMSFFAAYPLKITSVVFKPFVKLLSACTNGVLKLIGIDPHDQNKDVTEEEIRMMLDAGEEDGTIEEEDSEMINNIFELDDTEVSDVMTHRTEVIYLTQDSTVDDVIRLSEEYGHSRFPVCENTVDKVIGMIHVKDIIPVIARNDFDGTKFKVTDYMRKVLYLAESMPVKSALEKMRAKKVQLSVVVDEFGGTAGIVTMEDILESIVGDIEDEYDEEEEDINKVSDGFFKLDGQAYLDDVEDELDIEFHDADDDYDTIGGYLVDKLGELPEEGTTPVVRAYGYEFKVTKISEHRIDEIEARKLPESETDNTEKSEK